MTPDDVLEGVRSIDAAFTAERATLRAALPHIHSVEKELLHRWALLNMAAVARTWRLENPADAHGEPVPFTEDEAPVQWLGRLMAWAEAKGDDTTPLRIGGVGAPNADPRAAHLSVRPGEVELRWSAQDWKPFTAVVIQYVPMPPRREDPDEELLVPEIGRTAMEAGVAFRMAGRLPQDVSRPLATFSDDYARAVEQLEWTIGLEGMEKDHVREVLP